MIAGDLGADVVKVESPDGDPVRSLAPPRFGADATYYLAVNRHRRNVVADLRKAADFEHVAKLVEVADVVVENYLTSQVRSLNIDGLRAQTPSASGSRSRRRPRAGPWRACRPLTCWPRHVRD